MHFTELPRSSRLFLMTVVGTRSLRNGLTIRDTRFFELDGYLLIIFHTPLQRTQMEFPLSVYQYLTQFFALLHYPRRIFLTHTVQGIHHLLSLCLVHSLYRTGIFRIGVFDEVEAILTIFIIQRISRLHILQLHRATDISGHQFFNLDTVGTGTNEQLRHAFLRPAIGIVQIITFMHLTTHHLEILYLADMRFYAGLEEIKRSRTVRIGSHLHTSGIMHFGHLADERHDIAQKFHQAPYPHILSRTNTEHREHPPCCQSLADALTHLVFGQRFALKELLHQCFVVLGSGLDQYLVHLHGLLFLVFRDFFYRRFSTFRPPGVFLHQQHVNQGIEVRPRFYRILYRNNLVAVNRSQLLQYGIVVALFVVQLVYQKNHGFT